jgi:hypothetical protein
VLRREIRRSRQTFFASARTPENGVDAPPPPRPTRRPRSRERRCVAKRAAVFKVFFAHASARDAFAIAVAMAARTHRRRSVAARAGNAMAHSCCKSIDSRKNRD